ncbi:hypothetical protein V8F06_005538 [Rhypophila decipiens]
MGHGGPSNLKRSQSPPDTWLATKLDEISPEFSVSDRDKIVAELRKIQCTNEHGSRTAAPSKQSAFLKMDKLLRKNHEVPAWLAEAVRLLYHANEFGDRLLERLIDLGYDDEKMLDPNLPYDKRRPRMAMPDFVESVVDDQDSDSFLSDDYSPTHSDADDERNHESDDASLSSSETNASESDVSASTDSLIQPIDSVEEDEGGAGSAMDEDGSPVVRKSPRKRSLHFPFAELVNGGPSIPESSTGSESGDGTPIKREKVAATHARGRNAHQLEHYHNRREFLASGSDDTDPHLLDDGIKTEDQDNKHGYRNPGEASSSEASAPVQKKTKRSKMAKVVDKLKVLKMTQSKDKEHDLERTVEQETGKLGHDSNNSTTTDTVPPGPGLFARLKKKLKEHDSEVPPKRKPGRPVGSGLLKDKKRIEPTRLSERLRRKPSTSLGAESDAPSTPQIPIKYPESTGWLTRTKRDRLISSGQTVVSDKFGTGGEKDVADLGHHGRTSGKTDTVAATAKDDGSLPVVKRKRGRPSKSSPSNDGEVSVSSRRIKRSRTTDAGL